MEIDVKIGDEFVYCIHFEKIINSKTIPRYITDSSLLRKAIDDYDLE